MKNPRNLLITIVALLFVTQIAAVSPTFAQDNKRDADRQRLALVMDPNTDVEAFRTEMTNYFLEWESALHRFDKVPGISKQLNGLEVFGALQRAKASIAEASRDDLVRMRAAYAGFPEWREGPDALDAIGEKVLRGRGIDTKSLDISPKVLITDTCPTLSASPSFADLAVAEGVVILAEGVMEALPTDAATIVAREPAVLAIGLAKAAFLLLRTLRSQYDDCHQLTASDVQGIVDGAKTSIINNDNANRTTITTSVTTAKNDIVNNDNTNKTSIITNDNTNTTSIVTNDNSNKTSIINNDNSNMTSIINNANANTTTVMTGITLAKNELKDLILRTQIEADLGEADSATYVGFYVTSTAQGGHLDLVRSIVIETIVKLAGPSAAQANSLRLRGDDYKAAGDNKSAYQYYRKAYKTAVN